MIRPLISQNFDDHQPRCHWCHGPAIYRRYHDQEWGVPTKDTQQLFERISLESFQAGLSWLTILNKRSALREVFYDFNPQRVAGMNTSDIERLMQDARIIRNRAKIEAVIHNAACLLKLENGHLARLIWSFEPAETGNHQPPRSESAESRALSKELKKLGLKWVGPVSCYSLMQACALVNDHAAGCIGHVRTEKLRGAFIRPRQLKTNPLRQGK